MKYLVAIALLMIGSVCMAGDGDIDTVGYGDAVTTIPAIWQGDLTDNVGCGKSWKNPDSAKGLDGKWVRKCFCGAFHSPVVCPNGSSSQVSDLVIATYPALYCYYCQCDDKPSISDTPCPFCGQRGSAVYDKNNKVCGYQCTRGHSWR